MQMHTIRLADWSTFSDHGGEKEVYAPANETEVLHLVRHCLETRKKLRVVGLQTSFNTLWYCEDVMMTTMRLNAIKSINVEEGTITCEPGARLDDVHEALWEKGLTLKGAPAVSFVTVGGAVSTGSHGSGASSLSSKMVKCRLVTGAGETIELDDRDERLDAARISLGLLGVLTSITLKAVKAFSISVKQRRIPTAEWKRFLSEGEMSYVLWFPHTEYAVLMANHVAESAREGPPHAGPSPAQLAAGHKAMSAVREFANHVPPTFPARNRYLLDAFFGDNDRAGPAHKMLMSFTSDPIAGSEWALPVGRFPAVFAELQRLAESKSLYLPIVWLKKVEPESAWLAAAQEPSIQCGIYHDVIQGAPSPVKETITRVERLMLEHGGRPHLSKLIYMKPSEFKKVYPNWAKFDVLRRRMDPQGVFWSRAIEERFGGPA